MPARLRPTAPFAADAILVGDPGRALMLAQELLVQPKMSNHARGLWGYSGQTPGGAELSVQSTGMGGPSAALVLADLAEIGLRRAVRVGTATALTAAAEPGGLVIVTAARPGGSPGEPAARPDAELTKALAHELGEAARLGEAASFDTLPPVGEVAVAAGEVGDMQTATLLRRATELGVRLAAVLVVNLTAAGERLGDEGEAASAKRAGAAAAAILSG
jgi:purine-nucleoside phosphorylase